MRRYTITEIKFLKSSIEDRLLKMKSHTQELEKSLSVLSQVLSTSNKGDDKLELFLPHDILNNSESEVIKEKIKWKDAVYRIISNANKFLTSNLIFEKLQIQYPIELHDKRQAMKNISSALVTLVQAGKVGKFKDNRGLYYFGHSIKHFEKNGKPNMNMHEKSN